jgi:SAM-dependent methyltransferase
MDRVTDSELRDHLRHVTRYWDDTADKYLGLFRDELLGKPYDRAVLDRFAAALGRRARVCDAGCGPCGHVAAYLARHELLVFGIDISPRCVALARHEQPSVPFDVMDMGALSLEDGSLDGIVGYYALHNQPKSTLPSVVREFRRVLRAGGRLLIVAKEGSGEGWIDDPLGSGTKVFWAAFTGDELVALAASNGFSVEGCAVREPQPDEIAARRIYVTAVKQP